MNIMEKAAALIEIAARHCNPAPNRSAEMCFEDAVDGYEVDDDGEKAIYFSLRAIKHAVGIFHPDWAKACAIAEAA